MGRISRALVALGASAGIVACALSRSGLSMAGGDDGGAPGDDGSVPLDGTDDVPSPDAPDGPEASAGDGPTDVVSPDAPSTDAGPTGTVAITSVGTVSNATGVAAGTHLVYATHAKLWWLFWIDSTQSKAIQTSHSADFVHWSAGGSLPMTLDMQGQGGNFSVAYADIQGADVVHLAIGGYATVAPTRHHLHARALITGTTITFGSVDDVSDIEDSAETDPDGPATFVDALGNVWDATGWYGGTGGAGNEAVCVSTSADQGGATWQDTFGAQSNVYIATGTVHSHALATAGANLLVALCDAADTAPPTTASSNVEWMSWGGTAWSGAASVFAPGKMQAPNDWGVATLSDGHMHVARRATDGSFDHVRYDGMAWTALAAPPVDTLGGATGQGVVVLASGTNAAIVTIASDTANTIRMITWTGTAWGQWTTLEGSTASRGWVSGWSGPKNDAVIWTEGDGSGAYRIMGRVVSF